MLVGISIEDWVFEKEKGIREEDKVDEWWVVGQL